MTPEQLQLLLEDLDNMKKITVENLNDESHIELSRLILNEVKELIQLHTKK